MYFFPEQTPRERIEYLQKLAVAPVNVFDHNVVMMRGLEQESGGFSADEKDSLKGIASSIDTYLASKAVK